MRAFDTLTIMNGAYSYGALLIENELSQLGTFTNLVSFQCLVLASDVRCHGHRSKRKTKNSKKNKQTKNSSPKQKGRYVLCHKYTNQDSKLSFSAPPTSLMLCRLCSKLCLHSQSPTAVHPTLRTSARPNAHLTS